ncbi:hypothetical protein IWQ60_005398 [Tieghemiomyces parasiticus]|uniref:Uncharacterized protein n=1 Tax=Tieghemiomyces parasiticus TaxID=78921 RepID=A0A9W8DT41_9FUNG|nr:hypothetical protein IWQ60_005398 [Tieghemiomyces parasiticus]
MVTFHSVFLAAFLLVTVTGTVASLPAMKTSPVPPHLERRMVGTAAGVGATIGATAGAVVAAPFALARSAFRWVTGKKADKDAE